MASASQQAMAPSNGKTGFFDLPRELRDEIYSLVLDFLPPLIQDKRRKHSKKHDCITLSFSIPAVSQVNRQLRQEVNDMWYSKSCFEFANHQNLTEFVTAISKTNALTVRHMRLDLFLGGDRLNAVRRLASIHQNLKDEGLVVREDAVEVRWVERESRSENRGPTSKICSVRVLKPDEVAKVECSAGGSPVYGR